MRKLAPSQVGFHFNMKDKFFEIATIGVCSALTACRLSL
uniref:Uncharacterized protein n=1 Tax=Siphoviridae sp. ctr2f5 TaxID=2825684 RepID=A0A8S5QF14_9CAUD|nr:MAG TPA: hypothetical protein [Siphoviridae sp. ctr2f5]